MPRISLPLLAVFLAFFVAGVWTSEHFDLERQMPLAWAEADGADGDIPLEQLQEFSEIFYQIKERYVDEVDSRTLVQNALYGMVGALDPHSSYLSEQDMQQFQRDLNSEEFGGLGIYIGQREDIIEVIAPIYDTPAHRANIESGDLILQIDGASTKGMPIDRAVERMRGEIGSVLELEIGNPTTGEIRTVELVREQITTPSVITSLLQGDDGGYGYLRITRFQNKTMSDLATALNGLYSENGAPLRGILIDLRNNPGGYLDAGIGVAAAFLPLGVTVVSDVGRVKEQDDVFLTETRYLGGIENRSALMEVPLVVLVNRGSASASEIVAGALQDHARAAVVGGRTYGKASVQSILPLRSSNGKTALRLTMARYFTPSGRNIQSRGIAPDIEVAARRPEPSEGEDAADAESAAIVNSDEADAPMERPSFISEEDYQYSRAMQILTTGGLVHTTDNAETIAKL